MKKVDVIVCFLEILVGSVSNDDPQSSHLIAFKLQPHPFFEGKALGTRLRYPRNQFQGDSPTFDFCALEYTRQSLKKSKFILKVAFSPLSTSSMLKLPNNLHPKST